MEAMILILALSFCYVVCGYLFCAWLLTDWAKDEDSIDFGEWEEDYLKSFIGLCIVLWPIFLAVIVLNKIYVELKAFFK